MTAATPAPEHDDSGSPDGRTCSGPADAATPGQATPAMPDSTVLRAAILATEVPASGPPLEWTDRERLDGIIASWIRRELPPGTPSSVAASAARRVTGGLAPFVEAEALRLAQGTIAAQQPHAADGVAEVVGALREALGDDQDAEPETGETPGRHAIRLAAYLRERLDELHALIADAEPLTVKPSDDVKPAPGPANAFRGPAGAVRMMLDMPSAHPQPAPACPRCGSAGRGARGRIRGFAGPTAPCYNTWHDQDADLADAKPDLGTAWRLLNETREQLADIRKGIAELAADITASAAATRPSRKSQIEDECAIALRKLLEDQ